MSLDREVKLIWLSRYRRAYMRVVDIESELKSIAELRIPELTGLPSAHISTSLDNTLIRQEQLLEDYREACEELQNIKREVVTAINKIKDNNASRVVYLRHIGLYDWQEIADTMHYAKSSIKRYHRMGIDQLDTI